MINRVSSLSGCLLILATAAFPYVRAGAPEGAAPLFRKDVTAIQFRVNLTHGPNVIASDTDVTAALQAAADTWSSISGTTIHFNQLQMTTLRSNGDDGQNVISFQSNAESGAAIKDALAVTFTYFTVADGQLTHTDIVFNTDIKLATFSTTPSADTTDLQAVAAHEMGHSLGASHSGVYGSTMFYAIGTDDISQRTLSEDDLAFAREAYPAPGGPLYGTISGHLTSTSGEPLRGGLITAIDRSTGVAVGGISNVGGGAYSFRVPIGNYRIYAQPIDGLFSADTFQFPPQVLSTNFQAGFGGGNENPTAIAVAAGSVNPIDITVPIGKTAISIVWVDVNYAAYFSSGRQVVPSGGLVDVQIAGVGLDQLTEQDIRVFGPASVEPGSFFVGTSPLTVSPTLKYPLIHFTLNVPSRKTLALASIFVSHGTSSTALSGALMIAPARPIFNQYSLVNAFTFYGTAVAPGEDISLFGISVGPLAELINTPDASGTYSTAIGGVSVTFDGQPAPLFYASQGQINLQVPLELTGKTTTNVKVTFGDTNSDLIVVPVAPAAAGLYPSAINNDDGSLNTSATPAKRGSYIILYGTGQGPVSPGIATGHAAPTAQLAYAGATTVSIGGQTVTPYFSGLAPGFVGLWQISAQIPAGITPGTANLFVAVNGDATDPISLFIQ